VTGDGASEKVRRIVHEFGRLPGDPSDLSDETDLYEAGMTSHASVNVMLGLEDAFDVEFPDRMLRREVFETVAAITDAIEEIRQEVSAP